MSELEIQRRRDYKRNRKRWMVIQLVAIILLAAVAFGSFVVYNRMNRTFYIECTETSSIDYQVQYVQNAFFDEEWLGKDQAYISSLIRNMVVDFNYRLDAASDELGFSYEYKIDAVLLIANKDTGAPYYTMEEQIFPPKNAEVQSSSSIKVSESVMIDYAKYNEIAQSFVDTYGLDNTASCTLMLRFNVDVLSTNIKFDKENRSQYTTTLNVPLVEDTITMFTTASVPEGATKVLEYRDTADRQLFFVLGVVSASIDALLVLVLAAFLHLTRNEDITYAAKVRRILRAYGSYIQRMNGEFDAEGYQVVMIQTFVEMLGIRDTIQAPVLMSENRDETMTRFFIPTNTKILYTFEIKVDNYDQIYGTPAEEPHGALFTFEDEQGTEDAIIIEENVDMADLAEAMATPDVMLDEVSFVPDNDEDFEGEEGIEVVGVVWPEKKKNNKVYRYDPNGETLAEGDMVLVPTRDAARNRDVIRKAAVAHGNHRIDPTAHPHAIKKIIGVIKRHAEAALTPKAPSGEPSDKE